MAENRRHYPTALTGGPELGDRQIRDGLTWLHRTTLATGGQPLLWAPTRDNIERNGLLRAAGATAGIATATWRSGLDQWRGGPVLALWPSRQKLGDIADDRRTSALCVVPGNARDVEGWIAAVDPELLGDTTRAPAEALDPVVVEGLITLSRHVNHGNQLAGSLDHRDAVWVLKLLHGAGYRLPPAALYAWALAHDWPARGADRLRELAAKFEAGRLPRVRQSNPFRADIVTQWRTAAAQR